MEPVEFGNLISEIRKEKNMSMKNLADDAAFTKSYISLIENGHVKNLPKRETIAKLAKGLKVPPLFLLEKAGYTDFYIDEVFDEETPEEKPVEVLLPSTETIKENENLMTTRALSDDEIKRRLFDLHDYLDMNVDLYYKNSYLSNREREKIKKLLEILLD